MLDAILALGGTFELPEVQVGVTRDSPSHARIEIHAPNDDTLAAILQAILFVIDNPTPGGLSWPWGTRTGALHLAFRVYGDPRLRAAADAGGTFRGGRTLPYATLAPPLPPHLLDDADAADTPATGSGVTP